MVLIESNVAVSLHVSGSNLKQTTSFSFLFFPFFRFFRFFFGTAVSSNARLVG